MIVDITKPMEVKIVTTKTSTHCFYSGYPVGSPEMIFEPGMVGIYNGKRVPIFENSNVHLVDFWDNGTNREWRVALKNVKVVDTLIASYVPQGNNKGHFIVQFQGQTWARYFYANRVQPEGWLGHFRVNNHGYILVPKYD